MLFQCLCSENLQALQLVPLLAHIEATRSLHKVHLMPQEVGLQALFLLLHMERMTSGIAGGIQPKYLQHLKYNILQVAMNLQLTNSRPWDG